MMSHRSYFILLCLSLMIKHEKNHAHTQSLFQVPSIKQNTDEGHMDNNCNGSLCYVAHCSSIKLPVH